MFPALLSSAAIVFLLAIAWTHPVAARQAGAPSRPPMADAIAAPAERAAFIRVWQEGAPGTRRDLAAQFVADYPRTLLLREAYEVAARASLAVGDAAGALTWGERALRLLPENVALLVMVADLAAKLREQGLAERSARTALRLLDAERPPPGMREGMWNDMAREMRATARLALGRVAADRSDHADAQKELLAALALAPEDVEGLYLLGIVRLAAHDDAGAAPPLAAVVRRGGSLAAAASRLLQALHQRLPAPRPDFAPYLASLRFVAPSLAPEVLAPTAASRYAGSRACQACHRREFDRWQQTGMARMLRPYRASDVVGDFATAPAVDDAARPVLDGGRHFIDVRRGASAQWTRYPVTHTIGSKWQQAYATTLPDGRMAVFPIQFNRQRGQWLNYWGMVDGPVSARAVVTRFHEVPEGLVYQTTCAPCHTSQLRVVEGAIPPATATFREGGVNCETCHGPAAAHVDAHRAGRSHTRPAMAPPVRFGALAADTSVAICAQCHAQSAVHDAGEAGAVNYGGPEQWYRVYPRDAIASFPRNALYRDGRFRATTFISEAFARSRCFQIGGATCASCHDPHPPDPEANPTSLKFGADDDRMCVQCHDDLAASPERHTRHARGSEGARCVSCHMPRIAEALLFQARSHQIDDVPDAGMTARFGNVDSPNACLQCHRDRDTDWLTDALQVWRR